MASLSCRSVISVFLIHITIYLYAYGVGANNDTVITSMPTPINQQTTVNVTAKSTTDVGLKKTTDGQIKTDINTVLPTTVASTIENTTNNDFYSNSTTDVIPDQNSIETTTIKVSLQPSIDPVTDTGLQLNSTGEVKTTLNPQLPTDSNIEPQTNVSESSTSNNTNNTTNPIISNINSSTAYSTELTTPSGVNVLTADNKTTAVASNDPPTSTPQFLPATTGLLTNSSASQDTTEKTSPQPTEADTSTKTTNVTSESSPNTEIFQPTTNALVSSTEGPLLNTTEYSSFEDADNYTIMGNSTYEIVNSTDSPTTNPAKYENVSTNAAEEPTAQPEVSTKLTAKPETKPDTKPETKPETTPEPANNNDGEDGAMANSKSATTSGLQDDDVTIIIVLVCVGALIISIAVAIVYRRRQNRYAVELPILLDDTPRSSQGNQLHLWDYDESKSVPQSSSGQFSLDGPQANQDTPPNGLGDTSTLQIDSPKLNPFRGS